MLGRNVDATSLTSAGKLKALHIQDNASPNFFVYAENPDA